MVAGRPRKSVETHKAEGTYRADRHGGTGVPVLCGKPRKPRGLDKVASALWDKVVPGLTAAGIVSEVDSVCLAEMVNWYSRYTECGQEWRDEKDEKFFRMARASWQEFASLASRFGMNPSDRARLRVAPEDTDDPLLKLMG